MRILVTGASSGIGRQLAVRLAALGHHVYATARKEPDLRSLACVGGVTPLALDVRDAEAIAAALGRVCQDGAGLDGLVNNAGVGGIGPIAAWSDEELREIMEVDALGPFRVTRAFLPLLLESHGRIVNVGSQGGSISKKYYGPYCMAKHALEAFTTALADEVNPFGVQVSIVQPGGVLTEIGRNSLAGDLVRFRRAPEPFAEEALAVASALAPAAAPIQAAPQETPSVHDPVESESNRKPAHPDAVADVILLALFDPQPRRRYLVGTRWEGNRVLEALMERLVDANASPSLGYSRDELVAWLERKMDEGARPDP